MKTIPLSQGKVAIVDDADFEYLSRWRWCFSHGYAVRKRRKGEGKHGSNIYMHRVISNCPEDKEVDHANCDKLDNTRANLRICTRGENTANRKPGTGKKNKLGMKGVKKDGNRFVARVRKNNRQVFIKTFATAQEAHAAYVEQHKLHYGEFSRS